MCFFKPETGEKPKFRIVPSDESLAESLQHPPLNATEENYNVAWDLFKKRCERPRQIIQAHLKLILELPEITHDSPSNLRAVKEGVQTHVNALRALNQPVEQWDAFLVFILVKKLDKIRVEFGSAP